MGKGARIVELAEAGTSREESGSGGPVLVVFLLANTHCQAVVSKSSVKFLATPKSSP